MEMTMSALIEDIAHRVAEKLKSQLSPRAAHPLKGVKKTPSEMRCRAKNCKRRSKGPRFHYLCEKHLRS